MPYAKLCLSEIFGYFVMIWVSIRLFVKIVLDCIQNHLSSTKRLPDQVTCSYGPKPKLGNMAWCASSVEVYITASFKWLKNWWLGEFKSSVYGVRFIKSKALGSSHHSVLSDHYLKLNHLWCLIKNCHSWAQPQIVWIFWMRISSGLGGFWEFALWTNPINDFSHWISMHLVLWLF
jgi:hypothetical protein